MTADSLGTHRWRPPRRPGRWRFVVAGAAFAAAGIGSTAPASAAGETIVLEPPGSFEIGGLAHTFVGEIRNGGDRHARVNVEVTLRADGLIADQVVLEARNPAGAFERVSLRSDGGPVRGFVSPAPMPLPSGASGRLVLRAAIGDVAPGPVELTASLVTVDENGGIVDRLATTESRVGLVDGDPVERLGGVDRVATSVVVSDRAWAPGAAAAAVVARSDHHADALAAAPLAAAESGPLLLTRGAGLDERVAEELSRAVRPGAKVYLVGGAAALSAAVAEDVEALGFRVVRLHGADRYATAVAIARHGLGDPDTLLVTTGTNHPDALAAGAAAGAAGGAVLLTDGKRLPAATSAYLASRSGATRYAIGGPAVAADPSATPVAGRDRYATAAAVAHRFFDEPVHIGLASGRSFADALGGGADIAARGGPLLLTEPGSLPSVTRQYVLDTPTISAVALYGGRAAVAEAAADAIREAVS